MCVDILSNIWSIHAWICCVHATSPITHQLRKLELKVKHLSNSFGLSSCYLHAQGERRLDRTRLWRCWDSETSLARPDRHGGECCVMMVWMVVDGRVSLRWWCPLLCPQCTSSCKIWSACARIRGEAWQFPPFDLQLHPSRLGLDQSLTYPIIKLSRPSLSSHFALEHDSSTSNVIIVYHTSIW